MSRSDWLALVGLYLALLFGVPSLTITLADKTTAVVSFFAVVGITLFAVGVLFLWQRRSSPWTIVRHEWTITINDVGGRTAVWKKRLLLRSNHLFNPQSVYRHREISLDGALGDLGVEGAKIVSTGREAGDYFVEVEFPRAVGFWRRVDTSLSVGLIDCFLDDEESVSLIANLPIRSAAIQVIFPSQRLPSMHQAFYEDAGRRKEVIEGVQVGHRAISWECPAGLFGLKRGNYTIRWMW